MRILSIGNFSLAYVRDNWETPLREEVPGVVVDATPLLAQGDYGNQYCLHYILSLLRNDHFDAIFFYSDGLNADFRDEFFDQLRGSGTPVITFHADDEPKTAYATNARFDHRFDIVATSSRRGYLRRQKEGWGERVLYLPWGYNPRRFYPLRDEEPLYDVVFIGKNKQGGKTSVINEDGLIRRQTLIDLRKFCDKNGLRFKLFGIGWETDPELAPSSGGVLDHEAMLRVYARTRIVFNPGWSFDEGSSAHQIKLRHFEVAGCGAFQITNENPNLAELMAPDQEIVFFSSFDDLTTKILYYLEHGDRRRAIAAAGLTRVRREHSMSERVATLVRHIGKRHPATEPPPHSARPTVIQLVIGDPQTIGAAPHRIALSAATPRNDELAAVLSRYDYVHLLDAHTVSMIRNTTYDALPSRATLHDTKVLAVHCIARFPSLGRNRIQVDRNNFNGTILSADAPRDPNLHAFKEAFTETELAGQRYYLANLLLSPDYMLRAMGERIAPPAVLPATEAFFDSRRIVLDIEFPEEAPLIYPPLHRHIRETLAALEHLDRSYMVYGARGSLIPVLLNHMEKSGGRFLGFIDRSLKGERLFDHPVYDAADIERLDPDAIFIAATTSGSEIYRTLQGASCRRAILPLYDLSNGAWQTPF
ncbi:CgeB family protein [Endothiovibrio diazotrophicus]